MAPPDFSLSLGDIEHIADLARLELAASEAEHMHAQLSHFFKFVAQIQAVDTHGIEPLVYPVEEGCTPRLRDDTLTESPERDACQNGAPDIYNGLYRVPKSLNEASLRMADRLALYPHWQTHRRKWLYFLHFADFNGRHCAWRQRPDYCVIGDERLPEGSARPDAVCTGAYRNTFAAGALPDWRQTADEARRHPEVRAAAPYVEAQALLARGSAVSGVALRGIDPTLEKQISSIAMKAGDLSDLKAGGFGIALGAQLAEDLAVLPGDTLTVIA